MDSPPSPHQLFADQIRCSGLIPRTLAYLIDVIPITILTSIAFVYLTDFGAVFEARLNDPSNLEVSREFRSWNLYIRLASGIAYILYASLLESSPLRSTLGKRLFGMVVIDINGDPITFGKSAGRNMLFILSALPAAIGVFVALFNPQRRCWHDKKTQTFVVSNNVLQSLKPQA